MKSLLYKSWVLLLLLICLPILAMVVSTPMTIHNQLIFGLMTALLLLVMGQVASKRMRLGMALLTTITATRYIYWRITETLITEPGLEAFLSFGLLTAECYAWLVLVLSFFQAAWPLERKVVPLPKDISQWPSVDVYVPTYNESLEVVRDTVLAAQNLDYPADKLNIYLLDDGKRAEFGAFASQAGVGYITRSDNKHAKAGNLNNALTRTAGELICIFDCDHITTRAFLQATTGAFLVDDKLALIQTPHHFYSPDPFERNLVSGREVPHEGELFYGPIQKGNDYWNATFFCGSCAVIRRSALEEIGGFAVETVTEDAHTALKLQRKGWATAYLGIPLAAGLATERLALHIVQRARWARGMTQILRRDNPLLGRGLTLPQRLCYLSAMLHFQFPLARFVFLTAPLAYLLFGLNIIEASPALVAAYVVPHLFAVIYTNAKLVGEYRYTFWNEIYETVLTFHLLKPSIVTLFNPNRGKFDVTEKGGLLERSFFDFNVTRPHLFLLGLLAAGVIWSAIRVVWWDPSNAHLNALLFNVAWASFSALFLMAAVAVGNEQKQVREYVRINLVRPAILHLEGGYTLSTNTQNLSMGGMQLGAVNGFSEGAHIDFVEMTFDENPVLFPVHLVSRDAQHIRLKFGRLSIVQRRQLVKLVMGRADAWIQKRSHPRDQPIRSMWTVIRAVLGLFFQRWKERRLFAGGPAIAKPHRKGAAEDTASSSAKAAKITASTWLWRAVLVSLIIVGVLSTQRAWSQTAVNTPDSAHSSWLDSLTDNARILPDVAVDTQGGLAFTAPALTKTHRFSLTPAFNEEIVQSLRLQGNGAQAGLDFSLRRDEVATNATLTLRLRYSDALLEGLSRLNLSLNGIELQVIELDRFNAQELKVDIAIPPALIVTYNTLLLNITGQTLEQCNNLLSEDIWLEVLPGSSMEIEVQALPPVTGLEALPTPFFDEADLERLVLPLVLPIAPSETLLRAGTALTSHFAVLADFRGADFPVHHNLIPDQHALVIGTPEQMPLGIDLPQINGPTLLQQVNPNNSMYRLLVVTGQTEQEVNAAARYLALQDSDLTGSIEQVSAPSVAPKNAYDAPKWQALDEPIYLTSMASEDALKGEGVRPPPQRFSFRLPPNMYLWPGDDVTLKLGYEFPYGEWLNERDSRLEVGLNGTYLGSLSVEKRSLAWEIWRLLGNDIRSNEATLRVPSEQLYGNNQLDFFFNMAVNLPEEGCDLGLPNRIETRLYPDSYLDVRDAQYFAALPELSYWWNVGFPFTQWADLSQTTLLLPDEPNTAEMSTAFGLIGRMSAATGYPGLELEIHKGLALNENMVDRDVLVVAQATQLEQSELNRQLGPFSIQQDTLRVAPLDLKSRLNLLAQTRLGSDVERVRNWLRGQTPDQIVMGARSPLNKERSIVVATAFGADELRALPALMDRPQVSRQAVGDLVLMGPDNQVNAFEVGSRSVRGEMPWYRLVRWYAGQYVLPMLLAMGLIVILIAGLLYGALKNRAQRRMGSDNNIENRE
ncbi:UDP-forming cellulose synthase catalytic subunit [Vreelandella populi]|uniref:Cellulose synthase catalytic subunit [UDP-forming] n=1 Tax=Vreelandella populi TaxID=2498858 RepID=A0A3S0YJC9_9GAMM|nr:UDP-forming cellulose synthase catalytic subunit [Halomonas populi]RUR39027.1 UDP-forming cellulose synthase catalytic subunit [Halomonas populi]RUR46087.1 UDP-forming cellulose synthase catalytic subunit [Halomonas populi]